MIFPGLPQMGTWFLHPAPHQIDTTRKKPSASANQEQWCKSWGKFVFIWKQFHKNNIVSHNDKLLLLLVSFI